MAPRDIRILILTGAVSITEPRSKELNDAKYPAMVTFTICKLHCEVTITTVRTRYVIRVNIEPEIFHELLFEISLGPITNDNIQN